MAHALRSTATPQRGAAAFVVTLLLALAGLLVVAYTQRHVVAETRASANALRTAQAFEAAEAGLDWVLARLDDDTPIDAACAPSADATDRSFRDAHLQRSVADGPLTRLAPVTWRRGGVDVPLAAGCVRGAAGWQCACPVAADPAPTASLDGTEATPSFRVHVEAGPSPSVLRVVSTGCLRADAACDAASDAPGAASARVESLVALLPALRRAPGAAVVVGGSFDAGMSAVTVANRDGPAIQAGRTVSGDALVATGRAGAATADALATGDAALVALDADRRFARWFGMTPAAWRDQPAATVVRCAGDCGSALVAAVNRGARLVAVDGDLELRGPLVLGSTARPVALVVAGAARWSGDVAIDGVVRAASLDWRDATAASHIRGALLVDGDASIAGAASVTRDADVLAALQRGAGSLVRVDGSWKDF